MLPPALAGFSAIDVFIREAHPLHGILLLIHSDYLIKVPLGEGPGNSKMEKGIKFMRKMRHLVAASAAITAFGISSVAGAAPSFYVGGQAGYMDTSLDLELGNPDSTLNGISVDGVAGGVFTGVKFPLNDGFFVGAEANVGTSGADAEITLGDSSLEVESNLSYGAAGLLGYQISETTAVYGRLGYQRTEFEEHEDHPNYHGTQDDDLGGIRYGIGMESELSDQLALRLDWSQTRYSDESYGDEEIEPTESLFQAGVVFRF